MANRAHTTRGQHKPKPIPSSHHKHYWPYIPVLLMVIAIFAINLLQPVVAKGVLSYATEMSISELLANTNAQRAQNGAAALALNSQLTSAAQAKANDMIARNYWAHNTPDGKEPWVFFDAAGYKYFKAGENLAYGFSTSDAAVTGWMNSPSHRENLLDTAFTEVGFGFANGQNYNNSGPETVVVAEYGRPQVLAESNSAAAPTPTPKPATPQATKPVETTPTSLVTDNATVPAKPQATNTDNPQAVTSNKSVPISRIQTIAAGRAWMVFATGILTGIAVALLLIKHTFGVRHLVKDAERFVLHHPVLDAVLVAIVLIGSFLMQTTGFLK